MPHPKITFYDSIHSLPMWRFNLMQSYAVQDAGFGSSLADVDRKMENLYQMLARKDNEAAMIELQNIRISFLMMLDKVSFKSLTFICLIKEIDDYKVERPDMDDVLTAVRNKMDALGITEEQVTAELDLLKKNLTEN